MWRFSLGSEYHPTRPYGRYPGRCRPVADGLFRSHSAAPSDQHITVSPRGCRARQAMPPIHVGICLPGRTPGTASDMACNRQPARNRSPARFSAVALRRHRLLPPDLMHARLSAERELQTSEPSSSLLAVEPIDLTRYTLANDKNSNFSKTI